MEYSIAGILKRGAVWMALASAAASAQSLPEAPTPLPMTVAAPVSASLPYTRSFDLEWSQGAPFVGAADGAATTSHGYQPLGDGQSPTALIPAASGLSLVVAMRTAEGYRLRFDEARARYLVKVFGGRGNLIRIYVVYPEQAEIGISYEKLPAGPVYLSVHHEAGHPLQCFKLAFAEGT
jgi:hypothetical protein